MSMLMCVRACVCVCERERERMCLKKTARERESVGANEPKYRIFNLMMS